MPHPFFDARRFPWHRDDAQHVHVALYSNVSAQQRYQILYETSGANLRPLTPNQPADMAWREILNLLTTARALQRLCELVVKDSAFQAAHDAIRAIQTAEDIIPRISAESVVFVDRERLRSEVLKLIGDTPTHGVLLVRGGSGSGKSWTRYLVNHLAKGLGEDYVYFQEGLVSTVDSVVDQLFATLNAPGDVPPKLETDAAWFQKVCRKLQAAAKKSDMVCWIVADDLGNGEDGSPLLDIAIRKFFDQFALFMSDPSFAQRFRLILLDYPDGDVPSKWEDFWVEDRPDEKEVTEAPLAAYLLQKATHLNKQLGNEKALALARDVLAKADTPPPIPPPRPKPRLKVIHDELVGVIQKL